MVGSQYSSKPTLFTIRTPLRNLHVKNRTICIVKKENSVTSILYMYVFYLLTTKYPKKKFGTILTEINTTAMKKITTNNQIQRVLKYCRENIKSNHARSKATYCRCFFLFKYRKSYSVCTMRSASISTTPVRTVVSTVC